MESHKNQHIEIVHYKTKDNERDGIMWMKPQKGQMRTRKLLCSISGPKGLSWRHEVVGD